MKYSIEKYAITFLSSGKTANFQLKEYTKDDWSASKEHRKIYVVHTDSPQEVWYVGEAMTDIKTRFQRGFTSYRHARRNNGKGRNGYAGYKWITAGCASSESEAFVSVITFHDVNVDRCVVEAIEGEIVFNVRSKLGNWPRHQNEIHFWHPELSEGRFDAATISHEIFQSISGN